VHRALSVLASLAIATSLAACGDEKADLVGEDDLRECLADEGLGPNPEGGSGATGAPLYLSTAPDFSAYSADRTRLDVVVQGSEEKAERTAADVRSAMLPLGISDAEDRVIAKRNVVAVFADSPSQQDREAASSCLK
jgi:hypothetical protein